MNAMTNYAYLLEAISRHVFETVPYFRALPIRNFYQINPVSKIEMMRNPADFVSDTYSHYRQHIVDLIHDRVPGVAVSNNQIRAFKDVILEQTTGTTGIPGRFPKRTTERAQLALSIWRFRKQIDPMASPTNFHEFVHLPMGRAADSRLYSEEAAPLKLAYEEARRFGMRWLHVQPTLINRHVQLLMSSGVQQIHGVFRFIETTGEPLSAEERLRIANFFGCEVINQYGSMETWAIGYDRSGDGAFSLLNDNVYVEILRRGTLESITDVGEVGDVVITSLGLRLFPVIRYRSGDQAKWVKKGDALLLELDSDREANMLLLDGELVSGQGFFRILMNHAFAHSGYLYFEFIQFVQLTESVVEVVISPSDKSALFFNELVSALYRLRPSGQSLNLRFKLLTTSELAGFTRMKRCLFRSQLDTALYPARRNRA